MLSRRQDENVPSTIRRPLTQSVKKTNISENVKPKQSIKGEPLIPKDTVSKSSKLEINPDKPAKTPLNRKALVSLTNGTPSQTRTVPRQPLAARAPTTLKKPSFVSSKLLTTKTPSAKPQALVRLKSTKKVISVYTPGKPERPVDDSGDEIEYMPPTAIERRYAPPTPMRARKNQDDDIFAPSIRDETDFDLDAFDGSPQNVTSDNDDFDDIKFDF